MKTTGPSAPRPSTPFDEPVEKDAELPAERGEGDNGDDAQEDAGDREAPRRWILCTHQAADRTICLFPCVDGRPGDAARRPPSVRDWGLRRHWR